MPLLWVTAGIALLLLVFGAMLGTLLDASGATRVIVGRLTAWFGPDRVELAMAGGAWRSRTSTIL